MNRLGKFTIVLNEKTNEFRILELRAICKDLDSCLDCIKRFVLFNKELKEKLKKDEIKNVLF